MLFCQRGNNTHYKIYSACFKKNKWERSLSPIKLIGNNDDWDKLEQCYPFIIKHDFNNYLIYSGNNYGQGGLGIACEIK